MGWFWADSAGPSSPHASHPTSSKSATSPPRCPMHTATPSNSSSQSQDSFLPTLNGSCPIMAPDEPLTSSVKPLSPFSRLNPLNLMPSSISQSRAMSQKIALPLDRTVSSIPRGDDEGNWVYPSPQQMYNAMLRKGYDDTPEDAVESMVAVHNFLNEGAWEEIEGWESRFSQGLSYGWETCRMGEEGYIRSESMVKGEEQPRPRLLRFHGRPTAVSPKARIYDFLGRVYPTKFARGLPFDRHDWYVQRQGPHGKIREVRYVIDYYSAPPEPTGEPVFYLDVRPAIDGPTGAAERMMRWGGDVWHRASGAEAREKSSA